MEPVAATSSPDPAPPRRVKKRPGRAGLASVFVVLVIPHVWVGVGLVLVTAANIVFPYVAVPVTGHVVSGVVTTGKGGAVYTQTVAYELDGHADSTDIGVDETTFQASHTGDPRALEATRVLGHGWARTPGSGPAPLMLLAVTTFWNCIVFVFVYMIAIQPLLRWWLVRKGALVVGEVTEVKQRVGKGGRDTAVRYRFTAADGALVNGEMTVARTLYSGDAPLPSVTVFHHPRWPRLNVVYELSSWALVDA